MQEQALITTREEFGQALTRLRESAGVSVRQVAAKVGADIAPSTLGDWFAGRGLPSLSSRDLLVEVLRVCGVSDGAAVEEWLNAWHRVRRAPGRRPAGPEPYRGLAAFETEHAEWFFGRAALTGQLVARLTEPGLRLVVGASGSGKSSLLRAGVVPALGRSAAVFTPGPHPMAALARQRGEVLIVDQFEEVFTVCEDQDERTRFVAALSEAAERTVVVAGLRADFYGQAMRHPELLAAMRSGQLVVGPMREDELRAAVVEPARKAGIEIENGLVELLLREVAPAGADGEAHEAGTLPLVSHALYAMWRESQGRRLTIADYRKVGGIGRAVADSAEKVYLGLSEQRQELARRLFLTLVHVASDTAATRRSMTIAEVLADHDPAVAAEAEDVLDGFVAERLITVDLDKVQISHEALLTAWPRLAGWLESDRAGLVVGRDLAEAAARWAKEGDDPGALYRGSRLAVARLWAEGAGPHAAPGPQARRFLAASVERQKAEAAAQRRGTRRLRRLVAVLAALLLLTTVAVVVAVRGRRDIADQRNAALSGKVANESVALRAGNPALAAQLALAAQRLTPTAESRGAVLSTPANPYANVLTAHAGAVYAVNYSPDGRRLATVALDGTLRMWDVTDPLRPGALSSVAGDAKGLATAAFAPNGELVATAGNDNTADLWDVRDPRHPVVLATMGGHSMGIIGVAFSPDGTMLATASYDATTLLWNVTNPSKPYLQSTLKGAPKELSDVVFSPDGRTLAVTAFSNDVMLWDVGDPRHPERLPDLRGHTGAVLAAAFHGDTLATGGFDNTVRLWDLRDPRHGRPLATLSGHENGVAAIDFSPDGRSLATGSYDRTIRLWDLTDFRADPIVMTGHSSTVYTVRFSPDGRVLASGGRDDTVRVWDLGRPLLGGHRGTVYALAYSPDGRLLATASHPVIKIWDVSGDPRPLATLTGHANGVTAVAFARNGTLLASADLDSSIRLWDFTDPARPRLLSETAAGIGNIFAAAISPDGRSLVVAGEKFDVYVWDITDPGHPVRRAVAKGHEAAVNAVAFSPDGRLLATGGGDRTIRLWRTADLAPLGVARGHGGTVYYLAFDRTGTLLASGSGDRTARLWNVRSLDRPIAVLRGHADSVQSVAFSRDGRTLATAGDDRTAMLWDIADPGRATALATLTGHLGQVNKAAFSPDGTTLATVSGDSTARLWPVDPGGAARRICALAFPPITPAEWRQYLPDVPYDPPCPAGAATGGAPAG
ncbi:helix-turn-helix domain-containing protein [Nonomuraea angiospora]|uniref:nSTAND1 domain-containing NTPase n=1 Tax=Nonomuraea angiospora TaxID=46172 RepID=UPI0033CFEBD9